MIQHKHILVNAKVNNPMNETRQAEEFLINLVEAIDMKIIQGPFASYVDAPGNRGLTAIVMIETSHIAFHIWDEPQPALLQFDLYTCGQLSKDKVIGALMDNFDIVSLDYQLFDRATGFEVEAEGSIWAEDE